MTPPAITLADGSNDHVIEDNDGRIVLEAANVGADAAVVTVETPGDVSGLAIADLAVSVSAGGTQWIGPFPTTIFNRPGTDQVYISVEDPDLRFRAYKI